MSTLDGDFGSAAETPPAAPGPPAPAAPPLDRIEPLNLARRPFLNSRPVVRVSLLLWLLGLGLLLVNLALFQSYLSSSADKRQQIARGEQEVERQRQLTAQLQSRLDAIDLESQNERVDFLNEMIEERTFSWSLLLDRLAEVLPNDVRIERLTPQTGNRSERERALSRAAAGTRRPSQDGRIFLTISGETRNDEALLRFVDNLFAHPAFAEPNLTRDERLVDEGNLVKFDLKVQYIPGGRPQSVVVGEAPTIEELPPPGTAPGTARLAAPPAPATPPGPGGRP